MMVAIAAVAATAPFNCWTFAADHFHLPPYLLYAVATVESGRNPSAIAQARDGSHSVGLMQINSRWFPELRGAGITEVDLYRPCVNVQVGAWILSQEVAKYGYSWLAIGSYYAGPAQSARKARRERQFVDYADRVIARWRAIMHHDVRCEGYVHASNRFSWVQSQKCAGRVGLDK
jgi:soluble lytic murein transglycosylase-like protein